MTRFSKWASKVAEDPAGKVDDGGGPPRVEAYVVVNSILQSKGRGLKYRRSPNLEDKYPNKVATFGTVVKGTLHSSEWLKITPRCFLPVKVDGLYVLVRTDGGGLSIVRQEVVHATLHFRLEVAGCRHQNLGKLIAGTFARVGEHHGRPAYRRLDDSVEAACYFWDKRDGPRYTGWWFGPTVGCDQGWALNPCSDPFPPRHGWEVPWGEQVDPKLSVGLAECRSITVSGHTKSSYDGTYDLQPQAMNGHPWFKKASPYCVLYCFYTGNADQTAWNLDHREQTGVFDWADGGTFQGGHFPLGNTKWNNPYNRLTLTCEAQEHDPEHSDKEGKEHDSWTLIEPWEAWYSMSERCPVFYNSLTGERADRLEDTNIKPSIIRALKHLQPKYVGTVDRVSSLESGARRAEPVPLPVEPPSEPGVPYVVAKIHSTERHVAKIHKSPDSDSREYTFVEEGGMVELYGWDPTQTWRMCWHAVGLDQATGCWAWVCFFDARRQALFKPKDWLAPGPLPFGLLGVAIYEDDKCLLRQMLQERANLNAKEQNLTPLTLAEVQGRSDICVRLMDAGATVPPDVNRPCQKTPTAALLSALVGKEDFDLKAMDVAMDQLGPDMQEVAEKMLERIAEDQRLRRHLGTEMTQRERRKEVDEVLARKAREDEVRAKQEQEAEEAERWAQQKAEKRRIAREVAASNEERLRRIEQERLEQAQFLVSEAAGIVNDAERPAKPKGEVPAEPGDEERKLPAADQDANADVEIVRQRRAKMMEKRSKRMVEAAQASQSVDFAAPQPEVADRAPDEPLGAKVSGPDQAAIEMRREKSRKLREERQRQAKQEAQLQQQHEERIAKLEAEGDWSKVQREQRAFEIQMQEAKHEDEAELQRRKEEEKRRQEEEKRRQAEEDRRREAEEEEQRAAMDRQLKGSQEKWTCFECNFDNPDSSKICLFCETERGGGLGT